MDKEYGIDIDQDQKELLIERCKRILSPSNSEDVRFYDYIPSNPSIVSKHNTGTYDVMGLDLFYSLYSISNRSEPRYDLDNPMRYMDEVELARDRNGSNSDTQERTFLVPKEGFERFPEFVFHHYSLDELEELSEYSRHSFMNWRSSEGHKIPKDTFLKINQDLRDFYETDLSLKFDLLDFALYKSVNDKEEALLIEGVSNEDLDISGKYKGNEMFEYSIKILHRLDDLEEGNGAEKSKLTALEKYRGEVFDEIENQLKPTNSRIRLEDEHNPSLYGLVMAEFEEMGIVESPAPSSTVKRFTQDEEFLDDLREVMDLKLD